MGTMIVIVTVFLSLFALSVTFAEFVIIPLVRIRFRYKWWFPIIEDELGNMLFALSLIVALGMFYYVIFK
jgi:hypothetical protein